MKTLTVRLPDSLIAEIEQESQARRVSKSDVVRERLHQALRKANPSGSMRDLIGEALPNPVVLTTDADFKICRRHSRQVVPCLMP